MAFVTYPLNGIEYSAENAETYLCTRKSGVYSSDKHFSPRITGEREITITPGLAWIQNAEFSGKSVVSTENVSIAVPVADGSLPRIDRIVLRFDKAANTSSIALKQGIPASPAAAPGVTQTELVYELGLCTVSIPASSLSISASDVTDTRLDEAVCGLMRDGVTGIPTAALEEQANALLDQLRNSIAQIEAGSGVMLVTTYGGSADGVVKSADKLQTPRKIGNASFDGTANVTLAQMGAAPIIVRKNSGKDDGFNTTWNLTIEDNTEYVRQGTVSYLNVNSYPSDVFDCWLKFTTGSSITATFPSGTKYVGGAPTFEPGKTYEMSIKNGCVVCAEVVSA